MSAKWLLILRFYRSTMLLCGAVSVALAWLAQAYGPAIVPALLLGKALIYPLFIYLWIAPRYAGTFPYYRNLGIRPHVLLGGCCAVDFAACWLLLKCTVALLYEPI